MKTRFALILLGGLLAACTSNPHLLEGRKLSREGKPEEALAAYQRAAELQPDNPEVRASLARQRNDLAQRLVLEAENQRLNGALAEASKLFTRALQVDPGLARARQGLERIEQARRAVALLADATALFGAGKATEAEARLRELLAREPNHAGAHALLRELLARREAAQAGVAPPGELSKAVNLDFRDAPIRSVLDVVSRTFGVNFVLDKDVKQDIKVTLFVRNSTLDDVIKLILTSNQLARKPLDDNSYLIYPDSAQKDKVYRDLVSKTFYLANADVKQAQAMIKQMVRSRDTFIDEKLNMLVIKDTPEAVRYAEKLIASLDLPEPEVMLDVEILEMSTNKLLQLGLEFPNQIGYGLVTSSGTTTTTIVNGVTQTVEKPTGYAVASGVLDLRNRTGLTSYIANPAVLLDLRDEDGSSRLLAHPRIRVKNRDKAKIHIGDKVPVFTTTTTANVGVSASVNYLDVGLKLEVEPNISLSDTVSVSVNLEVSSISKEVSGPSGSVAYQIGTRNAGTTLRLSDGETQMLAGLINDEEHESGSRLPGLGNLPILGRLFGSQRDAHNKTEIVLLITPHIVRAAARPDMLEPMLPAGTDAEVGAAPLRIRLNTARSLSMSSKGSVSPVEAAEPPPAEDNAPTGSSPADIAQRRMILQNREQ